MRSQEWSQSQVQQSQVQSQVQHSSQEIKQDNLKTQLVSAITDLEGDTEMVDFGKENKTIDLMSPPQAKSPTPKAAAFTPTKQVREPVKKKKNVENSTFLEGGPDPGIFHIFFSKKKKKKKNKLCLKCISSHFKPF